MAGGFPMQLTFVYLYDETLACNAFAMLCKQSFGSKQNSPSSSGFSFQ
jgi:hypothetical protein